MCVCFACIFMRCKRNLMTNIKRDREVRITPPLPRERKEARGSLKFNHDQREGGLPFKLKELRTWPWVLYTLKGHI